MNKEVAKKRIVKFDIARALAIVCVLICHCADTVYVGGGPFSLQSQSFYFVLHILGRIGVPLFLFLSGALLLKKQIEEDADIFKFYKKNLLPLLIANVIWVAIYNICFIFINPSLISVGNIIKELLCVMAIPSPQMWYIPMIIGLYLAVPFIAKLVKSFSFKTFLPLMITAFVVVCVFPVVNHFCALYGSTFRLNFDLQVPLTAWVLYMLIGYYVVNKKFKLKTIWVILITLASFLAAFLMCFLSYKQGTMYYVWYENPFLLLCASGLFVLINRIKDEKVNGHLAKVATFISRISLAIFFIHELALTLASEILRGVEIMAPMKVMALFAIATVLSVAVAFIMSKIKYVSKYAILYKK